MSRLTQLPILAAWLEKKSPSLLAGWQRRYVAVADQKIWYWSEKFDTPVKEPAEINSVPLFAVRSIAVVVRSRCVHFRFLCFSNRCLHPQGEKHETLFDVEARDSKTGDIRQYKFRAQSVVERDAWVRGLQAHQEHMLKVLRFQSMRR